MAGFGANYIKFSPIKERPADKLPVYRDEGPVELGRLVKADLSVNIASGKLFAGNVLAENVDLFASASLAVETDDMVDEVASLVYGCEVVDKMTHYKSGDTPPEGGVAYYKDLMRDGVPVFKGIFHPRAKAALGNDSAQTRTDSINFTTTATTFTIFACNTEDWRITEEFDTPAEAKAWVDKMLSGTSTGSGTGQPTGGGSPAAEANAAG